MAGASPHQGHQKSNSHILALLSLKILLLAFFILLNALASFEEERRTAVVDSVRQAFQGILPAQMNVNSDPSAMDIFEGAESLVDALHQLFGKGLPIVESKDSPGSWTLRVDVPVADLFAEDGEALLPDGAETLRLIAGVLEDRRFAAPGYSVDVLYGIAGATSGIDGHREALRRAGKLVRELERQGLPAAQLSGGLLPDFPGKVRIYFTLEVETSPQAAGQGAEG